MTALKKLFEGSTKKLAVAGSAVTAVALSASAQAAYVMPAAVTAVFADMGEAWSSLEGYVWPVLGAVAIGMFVIRKFKSTTNKA